MTTQIPYSDPLRLPPRVAGGRTAYTVSLTIHSSKLKGWKLTGPFVRIRVLDGVRMVPEPGSSYKPPR